VSEWQKTSLNGTGPVCLSESMIMRETQKGKMSRGKVLAPRSRFVEYSHASASLQDGLGKILLKSSVLPGQPKDENRKRPELSSVSETSGSCSSSNLRLGNLVSSFS
jgi:hypothetical protein